MVIITFLLFAEVPAQEKTHKFRISSNYSPGFTVNVGDEIEIIAKGRIILGMFAGATTPGGISGYRSYNIDPYSNHGALLYKIGNGNYKAVTGPSTVFIAQAPGQISFVVNDRDSSNNSGYFEVMVSAGKPINSKVTRIPEKKQVRKKGFVYKSDNYWIALQQDPIVKNIFEGNFNQVFRNKDFEYVFRDFLYNYYKYCSKYIAQPQAIVSTKTTTETQYGITNTYYESDTVYVDARVADIYLQYSNKEEGNLLSEIIGAFGNNLKERTTASQVLNPFTQRISTYFKSEKFFRKEDCNCATMVQLRENFYRFALHKNSLQTDGATIPGAEKESDI